MISYDNSHIKNDVYKWYYVYIYRLNYILYKDY